MKIRMLTLMAGPDGVLAPDQVVNLPKEKAQALIEGGFAVAFEKQKAEGKPEAAAVEPPETTAKPKPKKKSGG